MKLPYFLLWLAGGGIVLVEIYFCSGFRRYMKTRKTRESGSCSCDPTGRNPQRLRRIVNDGSVILRLKIFTGLSLAKSFRTRAYF